MQCGQMTLVHRTRTLLLHIAPQMRPAVRGGGGGGRAIAITLCRRPRILPPSLPSIERPPLVSCQFARASHGLNEDQLTAILAYGAKGSIVPVRSFSRYDRSVA